MYDSDDKIAGTYGLPFLFHDDEFVSEDIIVTIKRVDAMKKAVVKWILNHGTIPSSSPLADPEERQFGIWLKVLTFYSDLVKDPLDTQKEERESNERAHEKCQYTIRNQRFPDDEQKQGDDYEDS